VNSIDVYASVLPTSSTSAKKFKEKVMSSRAPTLIAFDHRFQYISYLASGVEIGDYSRESENCLFSVTGNVPLRSVETPVAYNPLEATANDPPRSTMPVSVTISSVLLLKYDPCWLLFRHG